MERKKFIIIDGNSLANRAFYAIPLLSTKQGVITNAAYGFTNMLLKLFSEEKPDYLAVAFDKGRTVFRHNDYAEYKAQRKGMPQELRPQMNLIKDILTAMNIAIFEMEGYEADDLIGTMSRWAEEKGWETLIVTGDRDALQLIGEQTRVLLTRKGISELEVYDLEALKEKYNLLPQQIIDLKGLMGDSSDNIPGVPGIGEKTALKLLHSYGSLENVLANLDDFQGKKMGERIKENKELAELSKKLATIYCCIDIELEEEVLKVKKHDNEALINLYEELEFNNLLKNILKEEQTAQKAIEAAGELININDLERLLKSEEVKSLPFLLYFNSNDARRGKVQKIALKLNEKSYLLKCEDNFSEVAKTLKTYLENDKIPKITYDAKMAYIFFMREKIQIETLKEDVLLGAYLLDPSRKELSLQAILYDYLRIVLGEDEDAVIFASLEGIYRLEEEIRTRLESNGLIKLYEDIELPLTKVLALMELSGVKLDRQQLREMGRDLDKRITSLTKKIFDMAGEEFNINSPKQLGVILFEKLQLPVIKKTKTGFSTNAEVLETLAEKHEIVREILTYRQLVKLKTTYVDGLLKIINSKTGKVHTSFNQTITSTGRLSSTEPNLQNIPIRLEEGRKIRKAFVPSKDNWLLLTADYSQIELRLLAHIAQDTVLIEAFNQGQDIHARTAAEVFNVEIDKVTKEMRRHAKAVNFGIVYGLSDYGLSRDLGVSRQEAKNYIDSYFLRYAGVKTWIDSIIAEAREKGYVTTLMGRRRYLNDILSKNYNLRSFAERTAMNTPIQGSAADLIKNAMLKIQNQIDMHDFSSRMILQVHDELVFEVPPNEISRIISIVKVNMENIFPLLVPLKVDMNVGFNWYDLERI